MRASTGSPFFDVAEFKGVTRRACTTLPEGGGADVGERLRLQRLGAKIERLLQVRVETRPRIDVLRMHWKLRDRQPF